MIEVLNRKISDKAVHTIVLPQAQPPNQQALEPDRDPHAIVKKMKCFDDYNVHTQVPYDGQRLLGTRYIITKNQTKVLKPGLSLKGSR